MKLHISYNKNKRLRGIQYNAGRGWWWAYCDGTLPQPMYSTEEEDIETKERKN
jgi:hypothetical protein